MIQMQTRLAVADADLSAGALRLYGKGGKERSGE